MNFVQLHMTRERPIKYDIGLTTPRLVQQLIGTLDSENCLALLLDTKNKVNSIHHFSTGTLNSSLMHPREVFKAAILSNSNSIILAHNHPSGELTPSLEDINTTKRLVKAGELLGIKILDHVIVSDTEYYSMREKNTVDFGGGEPC